MVCDAFAAISKSNSCPLWTLDEFLTGGKHNTDKECYMCLFCSSVKIEAGDYIWTFPVIGFQIFFSGFYSGKHTVHMVYSPCFQEHA